MVDTRVGNRSFSNPNSRNRNRGLDYRLVQTVGADSISAPEQGRYGIRPYTIRGRKDNRGPDFDFKVNGFGKFNLIGDESLMMRIFTYAHPDSHLIQP